MDCTDDICCENILVAVTKECLKCIEKFGNSGDIFEKDES